jgi:ABC-type cobalamin/Fe3+-siderophores transport system ATPase subunit
MTRIVWTDPALVDLENVRAYIARDAEVYANALVLEIVEAVERLDAARALLDAERLVRELPEQLDTNVGERGVKLSGGEKQRTIIAKSLAQEPSVLLLDEPSTHLDLHHQVNFFNILRRLNRENNVTVICITHDLTLASQYVSRFILLSNGRLLAEGSPRDVVRKKMVEDLYHTPVSVGMMAETNSPYVFPIGI